MCWHKWTKWIQYDKEMIYPKGKLRDETIKAVETWQKRKCQKCGYEQCKEVDQY